MRGLESPRSGVDVPGFLILPALYSMILLSRQERQGEERWNSSSSCLAACWLSFRSNAPRFLLPCLRSPHTHAGRLPAYAPSAQITRNRRNLVFSTASHYARP